MTQILYAKKMNMTEAYLGDNRLAVTRLDLYEPEIIGEKTLAKHGYNAKIVAFGDTKKSGARQYIREVSELASSIEPGVVVNLTGTSKGKGLAGVVKKWGFAGGPRTHGQSDRLRRPGSIGQGTTPGRVYKGKHMAGRMGHQTVTIKNLVVVAVDTKAKSIWVAGPVPGVRNSLIKISLTDKKQTLKELKFLKDFENQKEVVEPAVTQG